jgi:hypothetical protein
LRLGVIIFFKSTGLYKKRKIIGTPKFEKNRGNRYRTPLFTQPYDIVHGGNQFLNTGLKPNDFCEAYGLGSFFAVSYPITAFRPDYTKKHRMGIPQIHFSGDGQDVSESANGEKLYFLQGVNWVLLWEGKKTGVRLVI